MGATGAAVHAFTDPARFCAVGMHAPGVFYGAGPNAPPWIFGIDDPAALAMRDPVLIAERFVTAQTQPRIWVDCGWDDPLIDSVGMLHQRFRAQGLAHDYHLWPGAHDGAYWVQHVGDYLAFYARDWLRA
jgi:acetyl esterase/lipase